MESAQPVSKIRPKRGAFRGIQRGERIFIICTVGPAVIYYLIFRYWPVIQTLMLSFTDAKLLSPEYKFVGVDNFVSVLSNAVFRRSVWNTTYYAFATTIIGTALALLLAFFLNPIPRGNNFLRMLFFMPQITSGIAIATIWLWLLQARFGLFNQVLQQLGLPLQPWLTSPKTALNTLVLMAIWGGVGYSAIIFVAGIRGIPKDYFESAAIDGANWGQMHRYITLPLLNRVISFVMVTGVIGSFQLFQQVYLMTRGGPINSTRTISLMIYDYSFGRMRIGEGATMAVVLFLVVSVLTLIQFRVQRREIEL